MTSFFLLPILKGKLHPGVNEAINLDNEGGIENDVVVSV